MTSRPKVIIVVVAVSWNVNLFLFFSLKSKDFQRRSSPSHNRWSCCPADFFFFFGLSGATTNDFSIASGVRNESRAKTTLEKKKTRSWWTIAPSTGETRNRFTPRLERFCFIHRFWILRWKMRWQFYLIIVEVIFFARDALYISLQQHHPFFLFLKVVGVCFLKTSQGNRINCEPFGQHDEKVGNDVKILEQCIRNVFLLIARAKQKSQCLKYVNKMQIPDPPRPVMFIFYFRFT